ncbi:MAG: TolC family protein [Elusimicrobiota bacterium]|jgi:outer membrane protein TolC
MKNTIILGIMILAASPAAAPSLRAAEVESDSYTLDECVRLSLRNNGDLQTAEQGLIIAKQRVAEARLLFSPDIGLQALATRYNARYPFALRQNFHSALLFPSNDDNLFSGQAYMSLSLYEGLRHVNTLRMANTLLKQEQSKYDAVKLDILYGAQRAFYALILAQELSSSAERSSAKAAELAKTASGRWERIEAEGISSDLRSAATEARHELALARLDFLKGLNKELDNDVRVLGRLETKAVDVPLKEILLWSAEMRPELRSQTYKSQMDAIAVNLALGRRYPTVTLGMDYELTAQRFPLRQNNWDVTLGVRLPLALDYWTQHTQRLAEQRQGEIARAELEYRVQLEVRRAYEDLLYWQAEWSSRDEEHQRLQALAEEGTKAGPLEQLRIEMRLLKARHAWLKALTEHILARARLERTVGRPITE